MNPQYGTALAQAAAQQQNLGGSPNSGQGNDPHIQNLQNLAQIDFKAGNVGNAMGAFGAEAGNTADLEAAARQAAEASARYQLTLKAKQMEKDQALNDPKNYIRQVSADGGYNFYKPDGTPISVGEYSRATGKQINEALSGSQSKDDQDFLDDYKRLKEYGAVLAGEGDINKYKEKNSDWLNKPGVKDMSYQQVVQQFSGYYNKYLQPSQNVANSGAMSKNANTTLSNGGWFGAGNQAGVNYK